MQQKALPANVGPVELSREAVTGTALGDLVQATEAVNVCPLRFVVPVDVDWFIAHLNSKPHYLVHHVYVGRLFSNDCFVHDLENID